MDPRWRRGAAAFNTGDFFTAHEVWEGLWLDTVGPEKLLLQGLIQIAAGYLKADSGLRGGALKLLGRGCERLRQHAALPNHADLAAFIEGVEADIQRLRRQPPVPASLDVVRPPVLSLE